MWCGARAATMSSTIGDDSCRHCNQQPRPRFYQTPLGIRFVIGDCGTHRHDHGRRHTVRQIRPKSVETQWENSRKPIGNRTSPRPSRARGSRRRKRFRQGKSQRRASCSPARAASRACHPNVFLSDTSLPEVKLRWGVIVYLRGPGGMGGKNGDRGGEHRDHGHHEVLLAR